MERTLGPGATNDYKSCMNSLDPITRCNLLMATGRIRVTEKQSVTIKFTWGSNTGTAPYNTTTGASARETEVEEGSNSPQPKRGRGAPRGRPKGQARCASSTPSKRVEHVQWTQQNQDAIRVMATLVMRFVEAST